ncbi:MAG: arsenite methyltransferase [candidate division WOR-3 bacterium]|nr:arsenite methyltransferase [candidate division WOR-3 bacterium]
MKKTNEIKKIVRQRYAKIAKENSSCCALTQSCCKTVSALDISKKIGYTEKEIRAVPKDANLSLGCGNPLAFASIKRGDVVLDLGSGAGLDVLLAARKVGMKGKVIGVDMTPEMIEKARTNAQKGGYKNVEFRLGEIENLPVADNSIDVIISNCVINLSPNKRKVFQEAFRVLKPGGKIIVADIMLEKELPTVIKNSVEGYLSCLSGATRKKKYIEIIKKSGFQDVTILEETTFPIESMVNEPTAQTRINKLVNSVLSVKISASKPLVVDKHR